jgi:hypothetical protein
MGTRVNRIRQLEMADYSPEKAGVSDSHFLGTLQVAAPFLLH